MLRVLFAWVGTADEILATSAANPGPILRVLQDRHFDRAVLLSNRPEADEKYVKWLKSKTGTAVHLRPVNLKSPTDYPDIYRAASAALAWAQAELGKGSHFTFHLSPGTQAMSSTWVILAKTRFPAALVQTSKEKGVEDVEVPFEIAAEFVPDLVQSLQKGLERVTADVRPEAPEFRDIIHRSPQIDALIRRAKRAAITDAPVLIEGESGTGKELVAQAIHGASRPRANFIPINCGAIPPELFEAELFGHKKGAFSGAAQDRAGHFEEANGGTLFLDEIGELPLDKQVKLLRVLQSSEVTRVGESRPRRIDVRLIAATNRSLSALVLKGSFREDLFYRVARLVLKVPALRDREGDVGLLVDHFLAKLNERRKGSTGPRTLSVGARRLLLRQAWPGNVRELEGAIQAAFAWSDGSAIEEQDVKDALSAGLVVDTAPQILDRPLGKGFSIEKTVAEVLSHYLERALKEAEGKKTRAAELVGLKSYQVFDNWLVRARKR